MININVARNTVLYLLDKNSRGYIPPEVSDSFMSMAQLDLFEEDFNLYNQWINKLNRRLTGTEYANIPSNIKERIDIFSEYTTDSNFVYDSGTNLWGYTGNDLYRAELLTLLDDSADPVRTDVEQVNVSEFNILKRSELNAPSLDYPVYTRKGDKFMVTPAVPTGYALELFYLRTPKTPKWTYINVDGNPMFNPSASDLQHVELHISLFEKFIVKVMGYCGVNLREADVVTISESMEAQKYQTQQQP